MSGPLVSILTPSFNQQRWLPDNIRSVAAQSYPRIEHIVMDGGSSDGSVEILQSAHPALRWRSEADRGQSHAINKAFAVAEGDIIGWLNSDDAYFSPSVVQRVVECFMSHPSVAVVYGHAALVNADGLVLQMIWAPQFHSGALALFNYIIQPAAFIRRSALGKSLVDERFDYMMDRELWLRLKRSHPFVRLHRLLAIDRHHPNRKSYTRPDLAAVDRKRLAEMYGVPTGAAWRVAMKSWKLAFRLRGVGLIRELPREPLAFGGFVDSRVNLLIRQVATLRGWMPSD